MLAKLIKLIKIVKFKLQLINGKEEKEDDLFKTRNYSWVLCFLKIFYNSLYCSNSTKFSTHCSTEAQNTVVEQREHQRHCVWDIFQNVHTNLYANDTPMFKQHWCLAHKHRRQHPLQHNVAALRTNGNYLKPFSTVNNHKFCI